MKSPGSTKIPLSIVDQLFVGASAYPVNFVFRYDKGLDGSALKKSLERTLQEFSPLSSHVEFDAARQRWFFAPSAAEVAFTVRQGLDHPLDTVVTLPGEPLIKVVLSQGDREDLLGVSMSHAAADGFSFFFFLSAWFANLSSRSHPLPNHDRGALDDYSQRTTDGAHSSVTPESFFQATGFTWAPEVSRNDLGPVHFTRHPYTSASPIEGASENAVLAAACLRAFEKRRSNRQRPVHISCAVDLRQRIAAIGPTYFGNAICGAGKTWDPELYAQLSDIDIAKEIHQVIGSTNEARARQTLSTIARLFEQEGMQISNHLHVAHPENGILVTNLSRLPLTTLDCGKGPPSDLSILTKAPNTFAITRVNGTLFVNGCERTPQS